MNETRDLVADSISRIFSERVDRKVLEAAEKGVWQEALWKQVQDSGFHRSLVPEQHGGGGLTWTEAQPILLALGYWRAPLPLAETLVGTGLLASAGLPCDMDDIVTFAQADARSPLRMEVAGGRLKLWGTAKAVPWARRAGWIVLSGVQDGQSWMALMKKEPTLAVQEGSNIALEPRDAVTFDGQAAEAHRLFEGDSLGESVLVHAALGRAIAMVGAARSALAQSVQYAQERQQFGRPIGKFQAVQHMLAVMACEAGSAAAAASGACSVMHKPDARFAVAVAKVRAGQAAGVCARNAHQVHGAFGMTYEHTLHFATKRLWAWRAEYGNETAWARELGAGVIDRGGANFWVDLTARAAAA